jgi:hypothetical protein
MMLSLMYLLIFIVWAIAVIVLKCKNARAKREAEEAAAIQSAATTPNGTVHVIQIGSNYYDVVTMPPQNLPHCAQTQQQQQNRLLSSYPPRYSQYRSTTATTPMAQVNQGFVVDEGGIFPTTTTTTGDLRKL